MTHRDKEKIDAAYNKIVQMVCELVWPPEIVGPTEMRIVKKAMKGSGAEDEFYGLFVKNDGPEG